MIRLAVVSQCSLTLRVERSDRGSRSAGPTQKFRLRVVGNSIIRVIAVLLLASASTAQADSGDDFGRLAKLFLQRHCIDCHDSGSDLELHDIGNVDSENTEIWKRIWEQVALKEMPPKDEVNQPELIDRLKLSLWITGELGRVSKEKGGFFLHETPEKANHLDHDLLFDSHDFPLEPTSTPARLWRIHPDEQMTRINSLMHVEPTYDSDKPGLRSHGDAVRDKIYYGYNRVIGWIGGYNQYRNSGLGYIAPLSTVDQRGIKNYPLYYSVNRSETMQILSQGPDVLRFMAYGPDAEPHQFADSMKEIDPKYQAREFQGSRKSVFYDKVTRRPITPIYHLMHSDGVSQQHIRDSVGYLFESLAGRPPSAEQVRQYVELVNNAIRLNGKEKGAFAGLSAIFLDKDVLFSSEMAADGTPDEHGRVMLSGHELALAINAAFSYLPPDDELKFALSEGRLVTRDDVQREVERMLADDSFRKPRVLQFFRSYFDYDRGRSIDKDMTEVRKLTNMNLSMFVKDAVALEWTTDRFVEAVLNDDKDVLKRLLTDDWAIMDDRSSLYYGEYRGQIPDQKWLDKQATKKKKGNRPKPVKMLADLKQATFPTDVAKEIYVRVPPERAITENPVRTPEWMSRRYVSTMTKGQRMGILTHPSWLISHSDAMDNHAIHRGKWIRERLLGGAVADVPITVDAMLPDEPGETLRHRMRVTREEYCWKCHQKMDPLGLPFEIYNHVGMYRTKEQGKPVVTTGAIVDSGVPELDGGVEDVFELIQKLAESERAEQVFVRYAFRYWMGRNETVHDGPILREAYEAYRSNGGSMKALLRTLLTSDAFLYRKVTKPKL